MVINGIEQIGYGTSYDNISYGPSQNNMKSIHFR